MDIGVTDDDCGSRALGGTRPLYTIVPNYGGEPIFHQIRRGTHARPRRFRRTWFASQPRWVTHLIRGAEEVCNLRMRPCSLVKLSPEQAHQKRKTSKRNKALATKGGFTVGGGGGVAYAFDGGRCSRTSMLARIKVRRSTPTADPHSR